MLKIESYPHFLLIAWFSRRNEIKMQEYLQRFFAIKTMENFV
jgi:hypothetical protein